MQMTEAPQFPVSTFIPLGVAFLGLGTGYLIFGPPRIAGFPARDERVDLAIGWWGVWMRGFPQFITGCYIPAGLAWFHSFAGAPPYASCRSHFFLVSILGITVFAPAGDWSVCLLFIGLMTVYLTEFFASFDLLVPD
jgi:hypothetical protein